MDSTWLLNSGRGWGEGLYGLKKKSEIEIEIANWVVRLSPSHRHAFKPGQGDKV